MKCVNYDTVLLLENLARYCVQSSSCLLDLTSVTSFSAVQLLEGQPYNRFYIITYYIQFVWE